MDRFRKVEVEGVTLIFLGVHEHKNNDEQDEDVRFWVHLNEKYKVDVIEGEASLSSTS